MRLSTTRGFTLIELLLVVIIIGLLAAIAIPKFAATREKSYRSAMMSDLRNLAAAQEVHHTSNYTYTTDATALGFTQSEGVTVAIGAADASGWSASSTHGGTPSACAVFYGTATAVTPATVPGAVTCN
ncbi:MAG: prepilin-type N-terminal cleavage/methylation domain-containing protein [Gemmatimonadetes bacterium]|nr:prepilin-type N-terminal cleavage/methylation domain-containing protein [Gemmatimonadota bacterium]NNF37044.1 prepilin-type N-terminal cleavage/methylation domain-containing protein [Gemmatimonadota bacterium]NNK63935.1 prepilin-type N-terminal cleavage/methylation domain-containing protein [Gemmatimonadota bacterium]